MTVFSLCFNVKTNAAHNIVRYCLFAGQKMEEY